MKFGLSRKDIQQICNVFKKYPEIEAVQIFGSRAMGNHKTGSDVDLVLFGPISHDTLTKVRFELDEDLPLPYQFDVVSWDEIEREEFKKHIRECGQIFYVLNPKSGMDTTKKN